MTTAHGSTHRDGRSRTGKRVETTREALKRLADKKVEPAYRGPRGNPETDQDMTASSVSRWELVLGG